MKLKGFTVTTEKEELTDNDSLAAGQIFNEVRVDVEKGEIPVNGLVAGKTKFDQSFYAKVLKTKMLKIVIHK